ncbi:MAG: amino acid adenylation domain-containing protein [Burkholderiaceae bacterium]
MTSLALLFERLRAADIRLSLEEDRLNISAPKGALTPELRAELERGRDAIKAHLRQTEQARQSAADGVRPIPRAADMAVSHTQQRLWFMKQMDPDNAAYNVPGAFRMHGALDVKALEAALADLVERHESLRTRFVSIEGVPRCVVETAARAPLERLDLRAVAEAQREAQAMEHLVELARRPFDTSRCPLLHASLIQLADQSHIFAFVLDHIVADGVSTGILLNELETIYAAHRADRPHGLAPLPVQYIDCADWQRRWLAGGVLDEQLGYWRQQLRGPVAVLQLPSDRQRPPIQTANGARITAQFSRELSDAVRALGRREGTTLFMTLLAAFQLLMHRYTGERDVVVGTAVANRYRPETERVVGFFANNLVLRADLSGNPSVRELLSRVRELSAKAYAHQDMPFDLLVETLAPPRALDHAPLFQVMFVLHGARVTRLGLPGLDCEALDIPMGTARFDLAADVFDVPEGLGVYFEYNTDLFDETTIVRMVGHYRALLEGFVADLDVPIGEVNMLTAAERQQLTVEWNQTRAAYPQDRVLHELFEAQVTRAPDAPALGFEGSRLTYGELNARANQLALHLRSLGAGPGNLVGLCIERSADMLVALLAIQKSGAAYVPLDPGFPADRLSYMLSDSAAAVLVTSGDAADGVELPAGLKVVDIAAQATLLAALSPANLTPLARSQDTAYVIYTSGSTGRPKGVAVRHGALLNFLVSMASAPGLTASDVIAAVTTISFDIAGLELYLPWLVGARVELISSDSAADGEALAQQLNGCGATAMQATPATWRLLLEAGWKGRAGMRALCGGEALPRDLADALLERVGELWNLYGPTETTIWSTAERVERDGPITIGRPIANTQVYVVGAAGEPTPIGVAGEICIGGAGVSPGYHRRPELTAERFVADRFSADTGATLYRTGDLGRWRADGRLEHLGRIDHQVKIRGFRIELGEIEANLAAHPAVRQAVAVAREAGPGDLRLVVYIVFQPGKDLTVSDVRRHLRRELPDYMIPSVVVALDTIPLTPNGKVDRAALPDPFKNAVLANKAFVAPEAGAEQAMASIWRDILHVDSVGAEDNFFELGGHSLLSLRVAAAVQKQLGWRMDARTLFFQNLRQVVATAAAGQEERAS